MAKVHLCALSRDDDNILNKNLRMGVKIKDRYSRTYSQYSNHCVREQLHAHYPAQESRVNTVDFGGSCDIEEKWLETTYINA